MEYLLLILSLFFSVGKNLISKQAGGTLSTFSSLLNLNLITASLALIVYSLFGIGFGGFSDPLYLLLGFLYALFAVGSTMLNITALRYGPAAFCSLIFCSGFIITTVFCALFFNEPISLLSGTGMLLLIFSIVAVVYRKPDPKKKTSYKFLLFSIPAMICSGSLGIVQKLFVYKYGDGEINSYLFLSFGLILAISLAARLIHNPRELSHLKRSEFIIPSIAYSLIFVTLNKLNLYLTGVIDGVVLFPFLNRGAIALTAIASFIIFKERLNLRQWIGTAVCIAAIIIVAVG